MKPSSRLDPCLSSSEEIFIQLESLVLTQDSKLDEFLRKGEVSQAVQLGLTVLKSTRHKSECGQTLTVETKTLVSTLANVESQTFVKKFVFLCISHFTM